MKKVFLTLFAFITILSFAFFPVKAENPNLFNPSPSDYTVEHFDGNLYRVRLMYTLDLLENHQYQLTMNINSGTSQSYDFIYDDLYTIYVNLTWNYFVNFSDAISDFPTDLSVPFETSPGMTSLFFKIETYWTGFSDATYYMNTFFKDVFNSNTIKVEMTGQVAPIDEIEPSFSYSHLQLNVPYYNLPTAAQIKAQLQAEDDQDGDVTDRIIIETDEYTALAKTVGGDYYLLFSVDDTAGNKAYLRIDINIIDDIAPDVYYEGNPLDYGAIFHYQWYNDDQWPLKHDTGSLMELFTYIDAIDGENVDVQIVVTNHNSEVAWHDLPGNYVLNVSVTDLSGNTMMFFIHVTVLLNHHPVITGPTQRTIEITTFNWNTFKSQYSATDVEDGVLLLETNPFGTTFNHNAPVLGEFVILFVAQDSLGRVVEHQVIVNVVDSTIPTFKINNITVSSYAITVPMSNPSVLQTLINSIVVQDAYYGNITAAKIVPAFPSFTVPATTNLVITATDPSGNTGTLTIAVTVQDDILPVINGATKIVKGKTGSLVLSEITAQISAVDNIDGILPLVVVSDGYTGNGQKVGSYLVRYKATDAAGNIRYHDVRVWVIDNVAPVWIVNDYFINLGINQTMSRTELLALLQASGMIAGNLSYTVMFVTDEYRGNEGTPGTYSVTLRVTYENGSEANLNVQMNVPEDPDVIIVTPEVPTTGFMQFLNEAWGIITNIWSWITTAASTVWDGVTWVWDSIIVPVYEFIFVRETNPVIPPVTTQAPVTTNPSTNPITTTSITTQWM